MRTTVMMFARFPLLAGDSPARTTRPRNEYDRALASGSVTRSSSLSREGSWG